MIRISIAVSLLAIGCSVSAQETFKCRINGEMVYQDRPCPGASRRSETMPADQRPGASASPVRPHEDSPKNADKSIADLDRQKQFLASGAKQRKISSIQYEIDRVESTIYNLQNSMHAELAELERRKGYANNNLAGATYLNSLANERQAVTARYDVDINTNRDRLKQLKDDLAKAQKD